MIKTNIYLRNARRESNLGAIGYVEKIFGKERAFTLPTFQQRKTLNHTRICNCFVHRVLSLSIIVYKALEKYFCLTVVSRRPRAYGTCGASVRDILGRSIDSSFS